MKNFIVTALYDEGYGGFSWKTDIESLNNHDSAWTICSLVDMASYHLDRLLDVAERQRLYQELVSDLSSQDPALRLVIWVSNDLIHIVNIDKEDNNG